MLAVLKAGAAFVALDCEHPQERQREMVSQTAAPIILTSRQNQRMWEDLPHLVVDQDILDDLSVPRKLVDTVSPDNLPYVVFTSGSTGKSKGDDGTSSHLFQPSPSFLPLPCQRADQSSAICIVRV
ncbi:hypothetical protein BDV27DRAFT_152939 [Aspergillus caelatus]|uniref:AMP-dependent synthetase/ligase domain-containing protein n=2 Tax=Aspergillus subgen. Circumdati TaxID=2720871 RepID=A0A5N7AIE7_9EURO|nr:uncharacterized protein BDV27DRAFT_152939 [Aspergillus caelatus]KAE8369651.1 hypothetical protein BDV27DRAFT_152939 [Aspergillus caelatus]KAE8415835.1 hypothetical protein BDV36DRAFT_297715 [Aspergillus pseudocaelatus]